MRSFFVCHKSIYDRQTIYYELLLTTYDLIINKLLVNKS
jgi:hypothetical protein